MNTIKPGSLHPSRSQARLPTCLPLETKKFTHSTREIFKQASEYLVVTLTIGLLLKIASLLREMDIVEGFRFNQ